METGKAVGVMVDLGRARSVGFCATRRVTASKTVVSPVTTASDSASSGTFLKKNKKETVIVLENTTKNMRTYGDEEASRLLPLPRPLLA